MMRAESDEFLRIVLLYCWTGWRGEKMGEWKDELIHNADKFDFPIFTPYYELTDEQRRTLWEGNQYFHGINDFFKMLEENQYKIQYRVMLARYRGKTICPKCHGTRLKPEAGYVRVDGIAWKIQCCTVHRL